MVSSFDKSSYTKLAHFAIVICFMILTCQASSSLPWLNYRKAQNQFTITNPKHKDVITFNLLQSNITVKDIYITNDNIWKSIYENDGHQNIQITRKQQNSMIHIRSNRAKKLSFQIKNPSDDLKYYISYDNSSKQSFKPIKQLCKQQNSLLKCQIKSQNTYILILKEQKWQILSTLSNNQQLQRQRKIGEQSFINNYKIINENPYTHQLVKDMLVQTLSMLCVQNSQYQGFQFYGLCSNDQLDQVQRHYSPLVIQILFRYNKPLGYWLTQNYLQLLQQKLFYSFKSQQWVPLPQHTQLFQTYLKHISQDPLISSQIKQKSITMVLKIQNGLLNNLLLSQVNHLSEEINYRQTNKIHPTILKMLTQSWKWSSPKARASSIYKESFFSDYYYHQKDQQLQSSVSKVMWLIKLIYQHIRVIKTYADSYHKQSLQQLSSLAKVIHGYVLDEPRAKQGSFYSILIIQKLRIYSSSIGYQSLLPFIYDISPIMPINPFVNLTSSYGLGSFPSDYPQADDRYHFRGNIDVYFNYKILITMLQKSLQAKKLNIYSKGIKNLLEIVQKKILTNYQQGINKNTHKYATSWTINGLNKQNQKFMAVINAVFLTNLKTQSILNSQINQQSKQKKRPQQVKI